MNRNPYSVQLAALEARGNKTGFAYFMEQGLGKTGTACMDFLDLVAAGEVTRAVVLCPNSFKGGWVDEIAEWGFNIDPFVYESNNDTVNDWFLRQKFDKPPMIIVNFESIRPKVRKVGKRKFYDPNAGIQFILDFIKGKDAMLIVDESIQVSTHDALQTVGAMKLSASFKHQRLLSGKPIKQGPQDLWSQMRILRRFEEMNFYVFRNAFCRMGGFANKQIMGAINEDILAERIDPYVFRATKADWTDLPPKIWMPPQEYKLTPEMHNMYKSMEQDFILWLNESDAVTIDAAITKYIKLAQIQAGFIFDEEGTLHQLVDPAKNPRLALLEDILENQIPGKAIVVYNHKPVRGMLSDRFAKMQPVFLHGGMNDEEIRENKRRFNSDRDCRLICITKAAKYGHTLLGDQSSVEHACADMVFYENTYALDDRSQLEDRPHRHGQLQDNMRYWDLFGTPLDRAAVKALQRKESIFQAVFAPLRKTGPIVQAATAAG